MSGEPCVIRTTCRLCSFDGLVPVLNLRPTPLANGYTESNEPDQYYPLYLSRCNNCGHIQLPVEVRADLMFGNYQYVSGTTQTMRQHLACLAEAITERCGEHLAVLEIGSNDGTLLEALKGKGHLVSGVEPAENLAESANNRGLDTACVYWGSDVANDYYAVVGSTLDCIVAVNVFAHVPDLGDFVDGVRIALNPGGWFVFEVGYMPDQLEKGVWDIVYHEHRDYHHLCALGPFLKDYDLFIVDAERIPTQDGSIRVWCRKSKGMEETMKLPKGVLELETAESGFFGVGWEHALEAWRDRLQGIVGQSVLIPYGAAAKLTTLMHQAGLWCEVVVDDNPLKQGLWTPELPHGRRAAIVSQERLGTGYEWGVKSPKLATILLTAHNFEREILERMAESPSVVLREARVISPIPYPRVVRP